MEVKGTAVQSIKEYVKTNHPDLFQLWLSKLPEESQHIFKNLISVGDWFPARQALVVPTETAGRLLHGNDIKKGAWLLGRYSAETALTGIYKVFLLIASPTYIIGRASKVFATYYRPIEMEVVDKSDKKVVLHMLKCHGYDEVICWRIGGWMEKALEMCGCNNLQVKISTSIDGNEPVTLFTITWD